MLWLIWSVAVLAALLLYCHQVYSKFSKHGVKHFRPVPVLGNLTRLLLRLDHAVDSTDKLYKSFPGEKFVGSYEFLKPVVILRDLELIKKVTVKDFEYFLDHRAFLDETAEPLIGRTLFVLQGQKWKDMRSTLSPAFTSSKIRLMVPFMVEAGDQMIHTIRKQIKENGDNGVIIDCKNILSHCTADVIASCAFGLKIDSQSENNKQFYEIAKNISQFSGSQMLKFLAHVAFPNLARKLKVKVFPETMTNFFRDLVMSTMAERDKHDINRNDMIYLLMEAKKGQLSHEDKMTDDNDAGFATVQESDVGKKIVTRVWSDDDLVAQAVLFFIAGFETVSVSVTLLLFELAANPEVQDKLVKEIQENHEKYNGKLDYNTIRQMVYLDMVTSELLRKWPPAVGVDRTCTKTYNLGRPNNESTKDYYVNKGEAIGIPVWAIHHSEKYFPEPEKFDPERFSEENKHNIIPFSYIPFGAGPRNCIGSRFALCEVKVLIYLILLHMEVTPCEKTCLPIQLANDTFGFKIKGGHWLRFNQRY